MTIKSGEYTDSELIKIFHDPGKKEYAFNLMVQRYKVRLYWHIRKILIDHDDSDDILQETFLKAWRGLETFREESTLFTWLYRIATNESLTFLRRKRRHNIFSLNRIENSLAESLEADTYFNGDALQKKLQRAILALPEKQRLVFNMKYYDELKYEEMADILETSIGSLKASFHHAVKKIEKYLSDD
jgi:RNA polymerase sigma-70 factor (ECF subfamily)